MMAEGQNSFAHSSFGQSVLIMSKEISREKWHYQVGSLPSPAKDPNGYLNEIDYAKVLLKCKIRNLMKLRDRQPSYYYSRHW